MEKELPTTIDEYIAACPIDVQPRLCDLRKAITEAAPEAAEKISWGMATFIYHGNLVHFSAQKNHIGFHPTPSAIEAFREELTGYSCSKGTVRLPHDRPLPLPLIGRMVRFRVEEQARLALEKSAAKQSRRVKNLNNAE